jgi:hypothetical protein
VRVTRLSEMGTIEEANEGVVDIKHCVGVVKALRGGRSA